MTTGPARLGEKDDADAAPQEIAHQRRAAAVQRMREMVAQGEIDFSDVE